MDSLAFIGGYKYESAVHVAADRFNHSIVARYSFLALEAIILSSKWKSLWYYWLVSALLFLVFLILMWILKTTLEMRFVWVLDIALDIYNLFSIRNIFKSVDFNVFHFDFSFSSEPRNARKHVKWNVFWTQLLTRKLAMIYVSKFLIRIKGRIVKNVKNTNLIWWGVPPSYLAAIFMLHENASGTSQSDKFLKMYNIKINQTI